MDRRFQANCILPCQSKRLIMLIYFTEKTTKVAVDGSDDIRNGMAGQQNLAISQPVSSEAVRPIFHRRDSNDRSGALCVVHNYV